MVTDTVPILLIIFVIMVDVGSISGVSQGLISGSFVQREQFSAIDVVPLSTSIVLQNCSSVAVFLIVNNTVCFPRDWILIMEYVSGGIHSTSHPMEEYENKYTKTTENSATMLKQFYLVSQNGSSF